ncbi:FxLYD domain-containing protein [Paenibacillus sp. LHD-38]|uniref:FxLYD domain-containing protein n=1 Tax=Paenibacillus sp. LHD-38 TaxID=3072143 RepID=UPI00280F5973|nr:FxLYD domain-containing protein [Paenibacillus sp. LHD-38]MDQ8733821.1 FxLYD domain-containing protein [Paenibacillus sp. LHD-38]
MYCHHCGKKRTDDAVYCSQCGRLLADDEDAAAKGSAERTLVILETAASIETDRGNRQTAIPIIARKRGARGSLWAWLMPIILALVTAGSVFSYYIYQAGINDRVIKLQAKAKSAALAGRYEEAQALLQEAADARPSFAAVQKDAEIVALAGVLSSSVTAAGKQLEEQKLAEAEKTLEKAGNELNGHTEPIFTMVKEQLNTFTVKLGVMKLTEELADLKTVDELAAKLNVANHLEGEEAAAVQEQIVAKIVDISLKEAESLLKKKSYSGALEVTAKGLTYAKDNEKLTKLEKQITEAQADYEKDEQQRLEQAMQQAAAEDLKNQTAAVEVVHIDSTLDEFGDLNIAGELKNAATRPIYSITVKFIVYDAGGNEVGSGTATAAPDYAQPGEKIIFNSTVYGVYVENTTVVVDHATWYLD